MQVMCSAPHLAESVFRKRQLPRLHQGCLLHGDEKLVPLDSEFSLIPAQAGWYGVSSQLTTAAAGHSLASGQT